MGTAYAAKEMQTGAAKAARAPVCTRVLDGFDDSSFGAESWDHLLRTQSTSVIYLTRLYQRTWWETFHRGKLLLIVAERNGQPIALAPFYVESGMVYFLGSEFESDYLDFIGDVSDPDVMVALLGTARDAVPDFQGFLFYFVSDESGTAKSLAEAAERICFSCYEEDRMQAPVLDLVSSRDFAIAAVSKKRKSLLQHERNFRRQGTLEIQHFWRGEEILPHLDEFFEQHKRRHVHPSNPSRFWYEKVPLFIRAFTEAAAESEWLRFTRIEWNGRPVAFHYGYCYQGRYFWGMSSFDVALARQSPGQVMLRQLLLAALEENAHTFDFGTGDQDFKVRFSTKINHVRTWGLYPSPTRLKKRLGITREPVSTDWSSVS
jgi:CelD/BcsL family acetyltransferase involved in cellulose biosynthesis